MNPVRAGLLCVAFVLATACGNDAGKSADTQAAVVAPADTAAARAVDAALTESQVLATIEAAEAASREADVDRLIALLASDVKVTMSLPVSTGVPSQTLGRDDIVAEMRKGQAGMTDRTYASRIGAVSMAADSASGTVDVSMTESYTNQGHRLIQTVDQVNTVALRDGEPKIVASTWNTTSLTIDGDKKF